MSDDTVETTNNIETPNKKCFVITPLGNDTSNTRRYADGIIDEVLRPVLENPPYNYIVKASHRLSNPGSISDQIIQEIYSSDLVIANLTDLNPNVMYELAFRHACGKTVIHICDDKTDLPFDIKMQRTIFYSNDIMGAYELKSKLISMLNSIGNSTDDKKNPIYNGLKMYGINELIQNPETTDFQKDVLTMLSDLTQKVNTFKNNPRKSAFIKDANFIRARLEIYFTHGENYIFYLDEFQNNIRVLVNDGTCTLTSLKLIETTQKSKCYIAEIDALDQLALDGTKTAIYRYLADDGYENITITSGHKVIS